MIAKKSGLHTVLSNLNKEIAGIKGRTLKGLIRAQIQIRRDMDKVSPTIPVDKGNLRASYYVVTSGGKSQQAAAIVTHFKGDDASKMSGDHSAEMGRAKAIADHFTSTGRVALVMGFSASYAWFVHEKVDAHFKRGGAGAKFMEAHIKNNYNKILSTVRKEAKVR